MLRRILANWMLRHQHPVSFALHLIGIPMTIVAVVPFLLMGWYGTAAALFLIGYAVQFIGHAFEGNDAGELIVFKKMLGLPYVAIVPRNGKSDE